MYWCHTAGTACCSLGRLVSTGSHSSDGASRDEEHSGSHSVWAGWPALQIGGIGIDTLCLNVLKFNCHCNLILLVLWGVSVGSYRILLWSCRLKALLGAHGCRWFCFTQWSKRLGRSSAYCLSELPCQTHIVWFHLEEMGLICGAM